MLVSFSQFQRRYRNSGWGTV